jgi:hypothetical protein
LDVGEGIVRNGVGGDEAGDVAVPPAVVEALKGADLEEVEGGVRLA